MGCWTTIKNNGDDSRCRYSYQSLHCLVQNPSFTNLLCCRKVTVVRGPPIAFSCHPGDGAGSLCWEWGNWPPLYTPSTHPPHLLHPAHHINHCPGLRWGAHQGTNHYLYNRFIRHCDYTWLNTEQHLIKYPLSIPDLFRCSNADWTLIWSSDRQPSLFPVFSHLTDKLRTSY